MGGAAALLLGANKDWTPQDVRKELVESSTKGTLSCTTSECKGGDPSANRLLYVGGAGEEMPDLEIECDADAVVGRCLWVGCFMGHGQAHCDGTMCKCDPGTCSKDGWYCGASSLLASVDDTT